MCEAACCFFLVSVSVVSKRLLWPNKQRKGRWLQKMKLETETEVSSKNTLCKSAITAYRHRCHERQQNENLQDYDFNHVVIIVTMTTEPYRELTGTQTLTTALSNRRMTSSCWWWHQMEKQHCAVYFGGLLRTRHPHVNIFIHFHFIIQTYQDTIFKSCCLVSVVAVGCDFNRCVEELFSYWGFKVQTAHKFCLTASIWMQTACVYFWQSG